MKKLFETLFVVVLFLFVFLSAVNPGWSASAVGPSTNVTGSQISTEGWKATYGAGGVNITPAATPTDVATIYGSATKTIRVKSVTLCGSGSDNATMNVSLVKRTAVNTAGTSASASMAKFDSIDNNATATVKQYTANPSGLGAGYDLAVSKIRFGVPGVGECKTWDFGTRNDKAVVLRGAAQGLAIDLNGGTLPTAPKFSYSFEWTEE